MKPAARRPSPSCCRCSAPTSRGSSARWRGSRSPSGCWIRRCTSSSPRSARRSRRSPPRWARRWRRWRGSSRRSPRRIRCSGSAAAGSGSCTRRSPPCRRAPYSRAPAPWPRGRGGVEPGGRIPLVAHVVEFRKQALIVRQVAEEVFRERQITVPYLLGTMIELPRAALTADEIAREAQFFSFGTNDLTQTTWGLSRDDAGVFLPEYLERNIIEDDPFIVLDEEGVGKLIAMAVTLGRGVRQDLKLGICGEHGGEPRAVAFCEAQKMNYVSCSPYRVPIARLAAAQAALAERGTMNRTRATV